jgi:hypothetical protein
MKTSNDYSPAVAVWPSGKVQACNVKRALLLQPDAATARLREAGTVCVYVRTREDAEQALRGTGGETQ